MIPRLIQKRLERDLELYPAVVLLGARQAGKTTLALKIREKLNGIYLDLESPRDVAKLQDSELYLSEHLDHLVILDEVHRIPEIFPVLRSLIDKARRQGKKQGLYLLLGSASLNVVQQSGESLAGRVTYSELTPFSLLEIPPEKKEILWVRGGFPESYLASDETISMRWRQDLIRTYIERDVRAFDIRLTSETIRRLWVMLAHLQGTNVNIAQLARNLDIDVKTVNRYIEILISLFLLRRLPPWYVNTGKRLTKSPKWYVRDSGLLHALLGITDREALLSHPILGQSWEGFVIEQIYSALQKIAELYYYRTSAGAEIDLLILWPDQSFWAIEIKRSLQPKPSRGFYSACEDLHPLRRYVVYAGKERYTTASGIEAIALRELLEKIMRKIREK